MTDELDDQFPKETEYASEETESDIETSDEGEPEDQDDVEGHRAGSDGDTEDEDEHGSEKEGEEPSRVLKGGRASKAVLAAKEEARKVREELEGIKRERDTEREQRRHEAAKREQEEEARKIEFMSPDEKNHYLLTKKMEHIEREMKFQSYRNWDNNDKADFQLEVSKSETAARLASKVEAEYVRFAELNSYPTSRKQIYYYLLGQEVAQRGGKAATKAKKAGSENIRRQTTKPGSGKSNVTSPGRQKGKWDHLEGVTF